MSKELLNWRVKTTCYINVEAENEKEARQIFKQMSNTELVNNVDEFGERIIEVE